MRIFFALSRLAVLGLLLCTMQVSAFAQAASDEDTPFLYEPHPIRLLQPLDGSSTGTIDPEPGIGVFFTYFNYAWPWVIGSAAGIGVLQALLGGIQIMTSDGKDKKDEGKTRLEWALAGLLMIGLSGLILETLNPLFFVQG